MMRLLTVSLLFAMTWLARGEVTGRYVRLDSMSMFMEIIELEVTHEGENLLAGKPELFSFGLGYGFYGAFHLGPDGKTSAQAYTFTDGRKDTAERGNELGPKYGPHRERVDRGCLEIDFGAERSLDQLHYYASRYDAGPRRQWLRDPHGWRVLTVLDENRDVVFSRLLTLYTPEYRQNEGVISVELSGDAGPLAGRTVPAEAQAWFSDVEFLQAFFDVEVTPPPTAPDPQAARFDQRNSPAAVAELTETVLRRLDLNKPGLQQVRELAEAGKPQQALEAFKARFLQKAAYLQRLHGGQNPWSYAFIAEPNSRCVVEANSLLEGLFADLENKAIYHLPVGRLGGLQVAIEARAPEAMGHRRILLQAYVATGDQRYLDAWTQFSDEWAMLYPDYANRTGNRDYFPLHTMGGLVYYLKDIQEASAKRPDLVDDLSAVTLARVLMTCIEEYGPSYWRLARTTIFNHQFNTVASAYHCAQVLNDFKTGERLNQEVQRQFDFLMTAGLCRDGSMIEVCDEGHVPGALKGPGYLYLFMQDDPPAWFDDLREAYFLNRFHTGSRYLIRHTAPFGRQHRGGMGRNSYDAFWREWMDIPQREAWRRVGLYTGVGIETLTGDVFNEPEARAIADTVFGRGQSAPPRDRHDEQAFEFVTETYTGGYQGPPKTVSDWMPYSGIHYLRRGWERDDSFIEMLCQPPGGSGNDRFMDQLGENWWGSADWDTRFQYYDYGHELLLARPLRIDEKDQYQQQANKGFKPGSKTERLVEAPRDPLPNRWVSFGNYDVTECFYEGAYQNRYIDTQALTRSNSVLIEEGEPLLDVRTIRQLLQLRGQRLFIAIDRVQPPDDEPHTYDARYLMQPESVTTPVSHDASARTVTCTPAVSPGIVLHQFGPELGYSEVLPKIKDRRRVQARWQATGETALVSLLAPHRTADEAPLREVHDLSAAAVIGFQATCANGDRVSFATARSGVASLSLDAFSITAELLVVVRDAAGVSGLVLGAERPLTRAGATLAPGVADYLFAEREGSLVLLEPILRPIQPPVIGPPVNVFTGSQEVVISSTSPDVEIYYTLDGSEPTVQSARYTGPFTIRESCGIQARAFRRGQTTVPFTTAGTKVSDISFARFTKQAPRASQDGQERQPGLAYDYLEDSWFRLFAWGDELPAKSSGVMMRLLDISMRQTEGPFGLRCSGFLNVPATGVYTFHAPGEYVRATREAGYDLRLIIDGEPWDLSQIWHARGTWSIALSEGAHHFQLIYADARATDLATQRVDYWRGFPRPWAVWQGQVPVIEVAGPGLERQPIPADWLEH